MENKPFPQEVEYRGTKAVIYLQKQGGKERYEVRYFDVDGTKQRTTFPSLSMAQTFADAAVREVVKTRGDFMTLRGAEAHDYSKAVDLLTPLGLNVEQSAQITVQCQQMLAPQDSIVNAVRYFVENRPKKSPEITVKEVVDELLDLKRREACIGSLHERDLRNRLGKFADHFKCPIRLVTPEAKHVRDLANGEVMVVEGSNRYSPQGPAYGYSWNHGLHNVPNMPDSYNRTVVNVTGWTPSGEYVGASSWTYLWDHPQSWTVTQLDKPQ